MYVCLCKGVTDKQISQAVASGASSVRDLRQQFGLGSQCGKCTCVARDVLDDALNQQARNRAQTHYPTPNSATPSGYFTPA